jgi:hypothetical protein
LVSSGKAFFVCRMNKQMKDKSLMKPMSCWEILHFSYLTPHIKHISADKSESYISPAMAYMMLRKTTCHMGIYFQQHHQYEVIFSVYFLTLVCYLFTLLLHKRAVKAVHSLLVWMKL